MRTIIDLPQSQIDALEAICKRQSISRAEAIRQAVARHIKLQGRGTGHEAFGLWSGRGPDSLTYENGLRDEWDR